MNKIGRFTAVIVTLLGCQSTVAGGFSGDYEVYIGDANGDGMTDLYIRQKKELVMLHGDIITPVILPPAVEEFMLTQGDTTNVAIENAPHALDATKWQPASNIVYVIRDINLDGVDDLILKRVSYDVPHMDDIIVYGNKKSNEMPSSARTVDPEFRKWVNEVNSWVNNPNYFEDNAPLVKTVVDVVTERRSNLVWVESDNDENDMPWECISMGLDCFKWTGSWAYWDVYSVSVPIYEYLPDYSIFNQNALQFSQYFASIFEDHALDPDSQLTDDLSTWIEMVLGADFKPWIYVSDDGGFWSGVNINPYLNVKMAVAQIAGSIADEKDRELIEANQRAIAEVNINRAKTMIFDDLRDGDLTLIELDESEVMGGFKGIKIVLVDSCGKTAAACGKYDDWYGVSAPTAGVKNVELKIVIGAVQHVGDAIEVLAHELRHLSIRNRDYGTPNPRDPNYYWHPAEVDARVEGRKVREYYGY